MMLHALIDAWPILALIALGVALLALVGRDRTADDHDLSDYHEPAPAVRTFCATCGRLPHEQWCPQPVNTAPPSLARVEQLDRQDDVIWGHAEDILPPAPAGMNAGSPLYAGMLFDTWRGDESPADTAARFLREIRDEALAGAR